MVRLSATYYSPTIAEPRSDERVRLEVDDWDWLAAEYPLVDVLGAASEDSSKAYSGLIGGLAHSTKRLGHTPSSPDQNVTVRVVALFLRYKCCGQRCGRAHGTTKGGVMEGIRCQARSQNYRARVHTAVTETMP